MTDATNNLKNPNLILVSWIHIRSSFSYFHTKIKFVTEKEEGEQWKMYANKQTSLLIWFGVTIPYSDQHLRQPRYFLKFAVFADLLAWIYGLAIFLDPTKTLSGYHLSHFVLYIWYMVIMNDRSMVCVAFLKIKVCEFTMQWRALVQWLVKYPIV